MNKKLFLLLSTYVNPLSPDLEHTIIISQYCNSKTADVSTFPIHLEYTQKIQRVDVNDQLKVAYITLIGSIYGGITFSCSYLMCHKLLNH